MLFLPSSPIRSSFFALSSEAAHLSLSLSASYVSILDKIVMDLFRYVQNVVQSEPVCLSLLWTVFFLVGLAAPFWCWL